MRKSYVSDYTNMWKIVTIVASMIAILALVVFSFQQKTPLLEAITGQKLFMKPRHIEELSVESEKELRELVNSYSMVVGVNIASANFESNIRENVFDYSKVEEINAAWKNAGQITTPLFTDDTVKNRRVVNLINSEFVCSATAETIAATLHPIINSYSRVTCTVAIPPGTGDFIGWINIFLYEAPSKGQLETLQEIAEDLAKNIHDRDVIKRKNKRMGTENSAPIIN